MKNEKQEWLSALSRIGSVMLLLYERISGIQRLQSFTLSR
jgi:hypothetical protein